MNILKKKCLKNACTRKTLKQENVANSRQKNDKKVPKTVFFQSIARERFSSLGVIPSNAVIVLRCTHITFEQKHKNGRRECRGKIINLNYSLFFFEILFMLWYFRQSMRAFYLALTSYVIMALSEERRRNNFQSLLWHTYNHHQRQQHQRCVVERASKLACYCHRLSFSFNSFFSASSSSYSASSRIYCI